MTRMIIKSASGQRVMLMSVYKADCAWSHIRLSSILHRLKVLFFRLEYPHKFTNSITTRFITLKALDQPDFHRSLLTDQIPFAVLANILRYPPTHEFEADVLCFYPDRQGLVGCRHLHQRVEEQKIFSFCHSQTSQQDFPPIKKV